MDFNRGESRIDFQRSRPAPSRKPSPFAKPIVARHIRLVTLSDHGEANAAAIAEFEPLPDLSTDSSELGIIPGFNDGD